MYPIDRVKVRGIDYPYRLDIGLPDRQRDERLAPHPRTEFAIKVHRQEYYSLALAHSTHVHGIGTYDEKTGVETPRVRVTLATGIPEATCKKINLGYRDWRTIRKENYANREAEGIFYEPKAGERLYHLRTKPKWAGGE